jgi:hypothetical protein
MGTHSKKFRRKEERRQDKAAKQKQKAEDAGACTHPKTKPGPMYSEVCEECGATL